jgi:hypothetical protein
MMDRSKLPLLAVAAAMFAPLDAIAADLTGTVQTSGNVAQRCLFTQLPTLRTDKPAVNVNGLNGSTLVIAQLTDPENLSVRAASFGVGFDAMCNYAHRIVVESENNGLWRDIATPVPPGFADAIPYTATLTWGDVNTTFQADATTKHIADFSVSVGHATEGQIELFMQILPGASNAQAFAPLLAGIYRDTVRVTVEPQ